MELNRFHQYELRIYRFLGINRFRKVLLLLERLKHHKDNGKNENYHPSDMTDISLKEYEGYLLYNAFLHCVSLLFVMVYFILAVAAGVHNILVDAIMVALFVIDVYCIILQRVNFLRIQAYIHKRFQRYSQKANLLKSEISCKIKQGKFQNIYDDYELICKIRNAFLGKRDCIIKHTDIESMKRICACVELSAAQNRARKGSEENEISLVECCELYPGPYTVLQSRANCLQKWLGISEATILGGAVVVTEDEECEMHYKRLIPQDTTAHISYVCCVLFEAYKSIVDGMEEDAT